MSPGDLATLQKIHDHNQKQIQMGRLAESKGVARGVKELGKRLVQDHMSSDEKVSALLRERHLDLTALATTTSSDPAHAAASDKAGSDFDRSFATQVVTDHMRAIDAIEAARKSTTDSRLRDFYTALLPVLLGHKQAAQALGGGAI